MRTLVLDQGYQPHRIVSWQRAILMLFDGKVEVVEEYDEDIRSVTFTIKMPSVVRLLRALRGKRGVKFSRMNVAIRDGFRCQYCSRQLPLSKLTFDHVVPRAQGGKTCSARRRSTQLRFSSAIEVFWLHAAPPRQKGGFDFHRSHRLAFT